MIEIRYASVEEADSIAEIHTSSWRATYRGIVADQILDNLDTQKRSAQLKNDINQYPQLYGIVYKGKEPAGYVSFGRSRDPNSQDTDGEIYAIYLHPQFFHQGIGRKLFQWSEEELRKKGYQRIFIWVLEDNLNARNFYEKHNYQFDGSIKDIRIGKVLQEIRYLKAIQIS